MADRARIIVIGSGPSGYTAAIYLGRARLEPVLFSGREIGGQLMYTTDVENFPGFPEGVNGQELMFNMRAQAERFGTKIIDDLVTKIDILPDGGFRVWQGEQAHEAETLLIATGASARMLGLDGEKEFLGRALSVCAVCDAAFYRDKNVYVVGGGDSAMEDTLALTKFASQVTVVHRRDAFRASKIMQERVINHPKVKILWNTTPTALLHDDKKVTGLRLSGPEGERDVEADGVFYAIGHVPATSVLPEEIQKNHEGYVVTNQVFDQQSLALAKEHLGDAKVMRYPTMTSVPGIFAAGDCVDFRYRQAITAAAYGTMAALDVERWLEERAEA